MKKFLKDVKYWPRNFIRGIKNLIIWFPIIWKDRQWDHSFFLIIMRKKLTLMENYFENGTIILDTKRVAKRIRICRILIDRLIKDEYEDFLYDKMNKKWGKAQFKWNPIGDKEYYELEINYKNVKTKEDKEKHSKEMKLIREHANMQRKQDKEYFSKMFVKYLDNWWE